MPPPSSRKRDTAMPSALRSIQRTASALAGGGGGASSSVKVERQPLVSGGGSDGEKQRMSPKHQRMMSVLDVMSHRFGMPHRGYRGGSGGGGMRRPSPRGKSDLGGSGGGKRYSVALPRNMLLLTLLAFFVMPLIMGVYMLFRQLFAVGGGGVASRYAVHPPQHVNLAPTVAGAAEGESAVSGPPPSSVPSVDVSGAPAGREDPSEAEEAEGGLSLSGEDGGQKEEGQGNRTEAEEGRGKGDDAAEPSSQEERGKATESASEDGGAAAQEADGVAAGGPILDEEIGFGEKEEANAHNEVDDDDDEVSDNDDDNEDEDDDAGVDEDDDAAVDDDDATVASSSQDAEGAVSLNPATAETSDGGMESTMEGALRGDARKAVTSSAGEGGNGAAGDQSSEGGIGSGAGPVGARRALQADQRGHGSRRR